MANMAKIPVFENGGEKEGGGAWQIPEWYRYIVPTDRHGIPLISIETWSPAYRLMILQKQLNELPVDDERRKIIEQLIEYQCEMLLGKDVKKQSGERYYDKLGYLEADELPDFADEGDEVERLPDIADEGDEIDDLPDVDDKDYFSSGAIERTPVPIRMIDNVFRTFGSSEEKHIERRDKMKDIVRYCNPLEMVKSVAYFSTVSLVTKVNFLYRAIDHYSPIELDETIVGDIKNIFNEVVTPQFVKDYLGNTVLDPQYVAGEMAELTCKAVDAATYIEGKAVMGAAKVVENAITFVAGTIADAIGHPEAAEKMYQTDIVGKMSEYIDENYNGAELIKNIGEYAEKIGEVGTYIGLSILAGSETAVAACAATVGIGVARAGEATREAVEKTGEYTHKALMYGIVSGAAAIVLQKLAGAVHGGMENVEKSLSEATKSIDGKVAQYIAEKVAGTAVAAGEGAIDTLLFDVLGILTEDVAYTLGIADAAEVDLKEIAKDVKMGALAGGILFLVSDILKDIGIYVREKQDDEIRGVEFGEKEVLTDEEKQRIKEVTGWSDEVIDHIENMDQYEIYKNADLHEAEVDGRKCLVKDIDLDFVDPKTGMTNRERIEKGRVPIDAKTGEKIELHHMGQDYSGPFAELCENSEHGDGNHSVLHPKTEGSWRNTPEKESKYINVDKPNHWKERIKEV